MESLALAIAPSRPFREPIVAADSSAHPVDVVRVVLQAGAMARDLAAAEEPLEIRLGSRPFVVIMRTPGQDRHLAAGFLLSEQIVRAPGDIAAMRYCTDTDSRDTVNVLNVWLAGDAAVRAQVALEGRRHVTANSACGVCGRRSIDDLLHGIAPVGPGFVVDRAVVAAMPDRLRAAQRAFDQTGGLHAAGLFDAAGTLMQVAEDVGRHNAVDKVIGAELLQGRLPLSDRVLFVSGRTSFEIVQKAVCAGIPVVASVSAPSSLAISLASDACVTLLGFVRNGAFNIYAGAERVAAGQALPALE
jgi:FdhD protein